MNNKYFEKLINDIDILQKKLEKLVNKEDITFNQTDILSNKADKISKLLNSFNQFEEE
jgi:predicted outer membrane protein